jgi:type II restriction enzyme
MNFQFDLSLAENYRSNSQKIRVLTENWVAGNLYCPICGKPRVEKYENNHPTGDFFCKNCESDFELKSKESKSGKLAKTITDGNYDTMISRITSSQNPNFFFMTYNNYKVSNFILIPNHFFYTVNNNKTASFGINRKTCRLDRL